MCRRAKNHCCSRSWTRRAFTNKPTPAPAPSPAPMQKSSLASSFSWPKPKSTASEFEFEMSEPKFERESQLQRAGTAIATVLASPPSYKEAVADKSVRPMIAEKMPRSVLEVHPVQ